MSEYTNLGNGHKSDALDLLDFNVNWWAGHGLANPIYILTINSKDSFLEQIIKKRFENLKGGIAVYQVYGTLDIVVRGDEEKAKLIAEKLYRETNSPVAIVRYTGQDQGNLYSDINEALDVTYEKEENVHLYNPKTESSQAILNERIKAHAH